MKFNTINLLTFYLLIFVSIAFGQVDTSKSYLIHLTDGSELYGKIISQTDSQTVFISHSGVEMKIDREDIQEITEYGTMEENQFYREDPNDSRLFLGPTARSPKKGQGLFSIYEIFFPYLTYGITDYISCSAGFSIFPVIDFSKQLFYISPKIRILNFEKSSVSIGASYFSFDEMKFGLVYAVTTLGGKTSALTLGIANGFNSDNFSSEPVMIVGGELQISNSVKFLSENWIIFSQGSVVSLGIRFFGKSLSGDFGLMTIISGKSSGSAFIPWLGFTYNF